MKRRGPERRNTPRTDAEAKASLEMLDGDYAFAFGHLIGFTRQLEHEISAIRQAITHKYGEEALEEVLDDAMRIYDRHAKN